MESLKHSLRLKLAVVLVGITAGTIIIGTIINSIFLGNYYMNTKQEALVDIYDTLNRTFYVDSRGNVVASATGVDILRNNSYSQGAQMLVINTTGMEVLANVPIDDITDDENMMNRIKEIIFNINTSKKEVLEIATNYEMYIYTNEDTDMDYIEMFGELDCGYLFLMRVSFESMQEVVSVANRFYFYVAFIIIVVGIILTSFIASKISKPIRELARVSKKMSNLEFDIRYTGESKDEIGVLGESMNEMSIVLEKTISELKSANNQLQNDIKEKTEIDELRKEFISNVSHELKTPIAIIQGYAEGLKESVNDDAESREFYCDVIVDEAAKMNKMVRKLLTLNQIEFGNMPVEYERFDIVQTIDNLLNQVNILIEEKGANVDFDHNNIVYVWADEFQIEEVISNYISNALNHLSGDKVVKITVENRELVVRVTVENTGDNIPDEALERIWEKFYKVDKARTREYGGSGIGLSIVKAIMDSIHMQCGAYNTPTGVAFWFEVETSYDIK